MLHDAEWDGDLVRDMTGIMTATCARRYGRCSAANRAAAAVPGAVNEPQDES